MHLQGQGRDSQSALSPHHSPTPDPAAPWGVESRRPRPGFGAFILPTGQPPGLGPDFFGLRSLQDLPSLQPLPRVQDFTAKLNSGLLTPTHPGERIPWNPKFHSTLPSSRSRSRVRRGEGERGAESWFRTAADLRVAPAASGAAAAAECPGCATSGRRRGCAATASRDRQPGSLCDPPTAEEDPGTWTRTAS